MTSLMEASLKISSLLYYSLLEISENVITYRKTFSEEYSFEEAIERHQHEHLSSPSRQEIVCRSPVEKVL